MRPYLHYMIQIGLSLWTIFRYSRVYFGVIPQYITTYMDYMIYYIAADTVSNVLNVNQSKMFAVKS